MKTLNSIFLILMLSAAGMSFGMEPDEQGPLKKSKVESKTLFDAIDDGDLEACKNLITQGVDVNAEDVNHQTPLYWASCDGRVDICQLLIAQGADVNKEDYEGFTPLFVAAENGHAQVCQVLIEQNSDVNQVNKYGWTPLRWAAGNDQVEMTALLLTHGSDIPDVEDVDQQQKAIIQQAVEGIIDGTFKFYKGIDKSVLMQLCMAREDDENSLAHEDYLPWDLFCLLKEEAEKLSLSRKQVEDLIAFFADNSYEQSNPVFRQKLEQYKKICL
ncbi:MAG: ankyrin repeat domain-containing protein [Candidatus Babeliales bacterium]